MKIIQTTDDDFQAMLDSGLVSYMDWKPRRGILVWENGGTGYKEVDGINVRWRISHKVSPAVMDDLISYMGRRFAGENYIEGATWSEVSREVFLPMHGERAEQFKNDILESKFRGRG